MADGTAGDGDGYQLGRQGGHHQHVHPEAANTGGVPAVRGIAQRRVLRAGAKAVPSELGVAI